MAASPILRIPVEQAAPPASLELRPRQVRRWLEGLPSHVTFEMGHAMVRHLAACNRARMEADNRLEIAEAHRLAARPILGELDGLYATAPLPLAPLPRAALALARDLLGELALAYRIVAAETMARRFATRRQSGALLQRSMQFTAARLFAAYKSYTPVTSDTWSALHEIYLCADALAVARDTLEADAGGTIADLYGEALLLSLTDPYRLGQGEVEGVLRLVREARGKATLGRERPATPAGGHFLVPCDTDKPPKPSIGTRDDTGGPNWRLLDANAVVAHLQGRLQATGAAAPRKAEADLIARLARLWGNPPKRTSRREAGKQTVAISMGIEGVGHFVSLEPRVDEVKQDEMLRRGITMPLVPLPTNDQSEPIPVFEWEVVNESTGGLRVRRFGPTEQPIAVGEVAGIRLHGKPHWAIGAVRWVTVHDDGGMEFGLQYLAPMARAVLVKAWGAPSGTGLLLPAGEDPARLLTSPRVFSHLRELELDEQGDQRLVRPGSVLEATSRFEIFRVEAG